MRGKKHPFRCTAITAILWSQEGQVVDLQYLDMPPIALNALTATYLLPCTWPSQASSLYAPSPPAPPPPASPNSSWL